MARVNETVLANMARAIVDEVAPEKILLFGSHATGEAVGDSDIDLLVVEQEPFGPNRSRRAELAKIRRALRPFDMAKDILVYSAEETRFWRNAKNHVVAHAFREGRILYEQ